MHSQLGLMDREGLPFRTTYTYRQQTPRDMHTLQRTGHEEFILYTSEGTLLQNADGMVCHHILTQGSGRVPASPFSPSFRIHTWFCVRH